MSNRYAFFLGALLAAVAVALGAYAAPGLENSLLKLGYDDLPKRMQWFETGVRYHQYHALGIICAMLAAAASSSRWFHLVPWLFLTGIVVFSGSLYAMALGPESWRGLGAIVPVGGLAMILGWIALACGGLQLKNS